MNTDIAKYDSHGMLWLAVLRLAIVDATTKLPPPAKHQGETLYQRRARLWLVTKRTSPGSLNWICSMLNLDPDDIRSGVKRQLDIGGVPNNQRTGVSARMVPGASQRPTPYRGYHRG